jgi:hypothetical protein
MGSRPGFAFPTRGFGAVGATLSCRYRSLIFTYHQDRCTLENGNLALDGASEGGNALFCLRVVNQEIRQNGAVVKGRFNAYTNSNPSSKELW